MTVSELKKLLRNEARGTAFLGTIQDLIADWEAMRDYIVFSDQSTDAANHILAALRLEP